MRPGCNGSCLIYMCVALLNWSQRPFQMEHFLIGKNAAKTPESKHRFKWAENIESQHTEHTTQFILCNIKTSHLHRTMCVRNKNILCILGKVSNNRVCVCVCCICVVPVQNVANVDSSILYRISFILNDPACVCVYSDDCMKERILARAHSHTQHELMVCLLVFIRTVIVCD